MIKHDKVTDCGKAVLEAVEVIIGDSITYDDVRSVVLEEPLELVDNIITMHDSNPSDDTRFIVYDDVGSNMRIFLLRIALRNTMSLEEVKNIVQGRKLTSVVTYSQMVPDDVADYLIGLTK